MLRSVAKGCSSTGDQSQTFTSLPNLAHSSPAHTGVRAVLTYLMDAKVGVGVKVVVFGSHVLSIGLLTTLCLATGNLEEG